MCNSSFRVEYLPSLLSKTIKHCTIPPTAEVREFDYTTYDTSKIMILQLGLQYSIESETLCAMQCKNVNMTCYGFSYNVDNKLCSLGSWLVPNNGSGPRENLFSLGPFCNTTANVTLQPDGDLTSCDKYACSAHQVSVGKNTIVENIPRYKSCSDVTNPTSPRQLIRLYNGLVVMCDTVTDGGGWTIFQRRITGDLGFNRNWAEYKEGFGDYGDGEFYLGNENIHCMTSNGVYNMRTDVKWLGNDYAFNFTGFRLANESKNYAFIVSSASPLVYGNHNNSLFSTYDRDNDPGTKSSCALAFKTAWWYCAGCQHFNLNGVWGQTGVYGVYAKTLSFESGINFTEMKFRPG
ncbi:fibrinogen-like protein A [Physella acuta]|uniref:fibrinogen-like protein A n=1 Tax=Physella acuta TaxID=109671 RepID=UPI0027DE0B9B|nr:fibrinogen-like protein A [Physella acuta]